MNATTRCQAGSLLLTTAVTLILIVFGGSLAGAADHTAGTDPDAAPQDKQLTLPEAVQLALDSDLEHEIALLEWENAQIDHRIAQAAGSLTAYQRIEHELQQRRAENTYNSGRDAVVTGTVRDYFNLQQAARTVEIRRRQAEVTRGELDIVREQVRIGDRSPHDALREQNRLAADQLATATAVHDYESLAAAFTRRLGLPADTRLDMVDEPPVEPWDLSLEASLEQARANVFTVWERETTVQLARMDLENLRAQNPPPLTLQKAENNLQITELNARRGDQTFENSVISGYHGLAEAELRLETSAVDHDLAIEAHRVAHRQWEAGLLTDLDWEKAEIELLNAVHSRKAAVHNYVFTRLDYLTTLGMPLGIGGSETP